MRPRVLLVVLTLSLGACATPPMADDGTLPRHPLIGTSWLAQTIDGTAVDPAGQSTLTFQRDDQVIGSGGCNRYFGRLGLSGSTLSISGVGNTRMMCSPAPLMEQEQRFLEALQAAAAWRREGDTLVLVDLSGRERLRLVRVAG
jgi:heat shock protein HslJ